MPVEIIDCHDPELCFDSANGSRFRCFYATTRCHEQDFQLFVSEQPDRTVQIIKLNPPSSSVTHGDSQLELEAWKELLQAAWNDLKTLPVTVAYVLEEDSDGRWCKALANFSFKQQGIVKSLASTPSPSRWDESSANNNIQIETMAAAIFQGDQKDRSGVISLLRNTIQFSDDCLLKTRLVSEDILALFALNPGDLRITLARSGNFIAGILVGDESNGPNRGHIEYLGVHSDYRRHSIASKLISSFRHQIAPSAMTVAVHEQNQASLAFFQVHNFEEVARYQLWTKDFNAGSLCLMFDES